MSERKPVDNRAALLMVVLCAIWGFQQVAMKAVAVDMNPLLQVAVRCGLAAIVLGGIVVHRRETRFLGRGFWQWGLLAGLFFAVEFICVGVGLKYTSASHMGVFLYTAPIFTAIGLHIRRPEERLSGVQWFGILVAVAGIAIAFSGRPSAGAEPLSWLGDALGLCAALAFSATVLTLRLSPLSTAPSTVSTLFQLVAGFVLLAGAAGGTGNWHVHVTGLLILSLAFQTVVVCIVSYLVWFGLLRTYLASRLGIWSLMTPVFSVVFGVCVLGDGLTASFVIGAAAVLGGIGIVSCRDMFRRIRPAGVQVAGTL